MALTAAELKKISASGITALMDAFVTPAEAAVWRTLYDTRRLPVRVRTAIYVADPSDDSDEAVSRLVKASKDGDVDPDFLRSGLVKVFADGDGISGADGGDALPLPRCRRQTDQA